MFDAINATVSVIFFIFSRNFFIIILLLIIIYIFPMQFSCCFSSTMTRMTDILMKVSLVAPLGLGLYWLVSNILMIGERLLIDKVILKEEK